MASYMTEMELRNLFGDPSQINSRYLDQLVEEGRLGYRPGEEPIDPGMDAQPGSYYTALEDGRYMGINKVGDQWLLGDPRQPSGGGIGSFFRNFVLPAATMGIASGVAGGGDALYNSIFGGAPQAASGAAAGEAAATGGGAVATPVAAPGADAVTAIPAGGAVAQATGQDTVMNAIREYFGGQGMGDIADVLLSVFGASQAEDAADKLAQNNAITVEERQRLADQLQNTTFQGYNVRLGPAQGVITSDEAAASGGDPMGLANQLMSRYQAQQAPYREGQFRALEQRLERQGLLGLKTGEGINPFHQAFAKGIADSDAAAFQQMFGQAQDAANSEVRRGEAALAAARGLMGDRVSNAGAVANMRAGADLFRNQSTAQSISGQSQMDSAIIEGLRRLFG